MTKFKKGDWVVHDTWYQGTRTNRIGRVTRAQNSKVPPTFSNYSEYVIAYGGKGNYGYAVDNVLQSLPIPDGATKDQIEAIKRLLR